MATPKDSATTEPFTAADSMSDLTLVVEDKKLYVHKFVLARASPVFKTMLYPEPGTSFQEKDAKEIPLPEKKYDDVVQFLKQIYPEYHNAPVTDNTLVELMALADEYDVNYLVTKCKTYITDQMNKMADLRPEQLVKYLWVSTQYQHRLQPQPWWHENLRKRSADFLLKETRCSPYFEKLSTEEKSTLILARCERLQSDFDTVKINLSHMESNFNKVKGKIRRMMEQIKKSFGGGTNSCWCQKLGNPVVCSDCINSKFIHIFGDLE